MSFLVFFPHSAESQEGGCMYYHPWYDFPDTICLPSTVCSGREKYRYCICLPSIFLVKISPVLLFISLTGKIILNQR